MTESRVARFRQRTNAARKHMELVIAEAEAGPAFDDLLKDVEDRVAARVEKNLAEGRRQAAMLRSVSDAVAPLVEAAKEAEFTGAEAVFVFRVVQLLSPLVPDFKAALEATVKDHGLLIEESVRRTLREFSEWVPQFEDKLYASALAYAREYEQDLEKDAANIDAHTNEWDHTIGDGLND